MKRRCLKCGKIFEGAYSQLICNPCYKSEKKPDPKDCLETLEVVDDKTVTNHPERYNGGSEYECYKVLKNWLSPEQYKGFLLGNALKYQCRLGKKDDEVQEINKAEWYLNELKNCYGENK